MAAATEVLSGNFLELTAIGEDWDWTDTWGTTSEGVYIEFIAFKPGAASDKLSIKEGTAAGPEIFPSVPRLSTSDGQIVYYGGKQIRPYLDFSDCTFSSGHEVFIMLAQ